MYMYKVTQIPFISFFNDKYIRIQSGIVASAPQGKLATLYPRGDFSFYLLGFLSNLTRKGTLLALIQG